MSAFEKPNHTQVPNLFFELMPDMSDVELRVTLHAIRQTFGWHKQRDAISLTQFQDATGLSRQGVLNGIEEAEKRGTLKKAGTGKRNTTIFELVVIDKPNNVIPLDQSTQLTSTSQDSRPEVVNTVDTQKKEKKNKETPPISPIQDTSLTADKNEQATQMQELVKTELKQYDQKRSRKVACGLLGYLMGDNAQYNLEVPITPKQFLEFVTWWDKTKVKPDGEVLTRPKNLGSVKSNVMEWQATIVQAKPKFRIAPVTDLKRPSLTSDYLPARKKKPESA